MLDRDPNKRRVKPVQPHLLQLDFAGLDDSSDDSDFQIPNGNGSDDDDDDDDDEASSKEKSSIESGSGVESLSEEEHMGTAGKMEGEGMSMGELIQQAKMQSLFEQTAPSEDTGVSSVSSRKVKVLICCVCLGDISEEEDEIVECDGCSISVHEGCYGISESQSVASTASSASTAPWFCDACKAGVTPHCELCPNSGGIYKETDASRWVHLVCALYIPGIAFGDVDKLSPVTLFEMPYSRWGAKLSLSTQGVGADTSCPSPPRGCVLTPAVPLHPGGEC
ncbi:hypothetical protein LSAT2_001646 [Lamellibrachia satsuma]|nr:hypothetical protein LSAT2_001646 [Lamellibrachia satsuma]